MARLMEKYFKDANEMLTKPLNSFCEMHEFYNSMNSKLAPEDQILKNKKKNKESS
jgi:hypothetical protein